MTGFAWFCSLLLTATFAWAGVAKIVRWRSWLSALAAYRVPVSAGRVASLAVPAGEIGVVALLVAGASRAGAGLALALLAAFSAVLVHSGQGGRKRLPCGCFGRSKERDLRAMVARNALLAAAASIVLLAGRDVWLFDGVALPRSSELAPATLILAGAAIGAWAVWQTTRSFRRRGE